MNSMTDREDPKTADLVLQNAAVHIYSDTVGEVQIHHVDVAIHKGKISAIGSLGSLKSKTYQDLKGLHLLPGAIDTQVHFREPGLTHKEDLASGTLGAIFGGVTSIFEMPNTNPSTTTDESLEWKAKRARETSHCDWGFYVGACAENVAELSRLEKIPYVPGVKVFMGSSTGNLLIDDEELLKKVLKSTNGIVAVHAEDEKRLKERKAIVLESKKVSDHPIWRDEETAFLATEKLLYWAEYYRRRVHVLHVTTEEEMRFLQGKKNFCTVEVTPQHLTLAAPECYERLGTLAQMNPPIRSLRHQMALWRGIEDGTVDVLGSDHAPHTLEEKNKEYPSTPSGMTGVQTMIPVMLNHVNQGRLRFERLTELVTENPRKIFGIQNKGRIAVGYDADLMVVDMQREWVIENSWIRSKSQWTPFSGMKIKGKVVSTFLRGTAVMINDEHVQDLRGEGLKFDRS